MTEEKDSLKIMLAVTAVYISPDKYFCIIYSPTCYGQVMLQEWKMKESPKKFVMGNFTLQDQWENQEHDGRTLSRGTYHRS
jgi:hypothetical protein